MKQKISKLFDKITNFIKYNKQFCAFVILSLLCSTLIKYNTLGEFLAFQSFFLDLAFILTLGSFGFYYKPSKQYNYYLVLLLIFTTMGIANAIYYSFYNSFASVSLLTTLGQVSEVGDAVIDKLELNHFVYLVFPFAFLLIHKRLKSKDYFNYVAKFEVGKKLFLGTLLTGITIFILISFTLSKTAYSRLSKQWNREYIVSKFGMISYQVNDLFSTLKPKITSLFGYDVALKQFTDFIEVNPPTKSSNKYSNIYKDKSIIFIHMESVPTFLVDLKINEREITPNLNKLSKEGLYFSNFYPQIGVGTSADTEFTLTTSLMPVTNGTAFVNYFDRTFISLPNLLKDNGYYTFSMHGNKASMWNRHKMHPSLGYKDLYFQTSYEIDEIIGLGLSDSSFFSQSIEVLKEIETKNEKYMGTIITLSHHTPFENNELFEQIDLSNQIIEVDLSDETKKNYLEDTKLGNFLRSALYSDKALGEFMDSIKNSEYFEDTVFVFYGDHDPKMASKEFRNYYNYDFETGNYFTEEDEEYVTYDYYDNELNRKTPLIIWTKDKPISKQVDYFMGMIDVLPTIGNMVGIFNPYALGHDIFEIKNNNLIAFPNGNFLTNKVYYNNSKEEYRVISLEEILSDDYISICKEQTDKLIEISNGVVIHNLIKHKLEQELVQ